MDGKRELFDCLCILGPLKGGPQDAPSKAADLERELARAGVGRALVHHSTAREYSPAYGNARLMDEIAGNAFFEPWWVVMPHHTGEMPPGDELVAAMLDSGVHAACAYPSRSEQNFSMSEWCVGELLDALEGARLPLFVRAGELDWDSIHEICTAHPHLPLVLTKPGYRTARYTFALAKRHPSLHVEISSLEGHGELEATARRFGPERLLFGTGMPETTVGAGAALLALADLPDRDLGLIAGGNLRRLLDGAGR